MSEENSANPLPGDQHSEWEQQINALIDGELADEQLAALVALTASEPVLQRRLEQARQLQDALQRLPAQNAPRSLRRKLGQIGGEDTGFAALLPSWWRWGVIAAAVPLLLIFTLDAQQRSPSAAELEQGRRDLVVALGYLQAAGHKAALEIDGSIRAGAVKPIVEPIKDHTVRLLSSQMTNNEEISL